MGVTKMNTQPPRTLKQELTNLIPASSNLNNVNNIQPQALNLFLKLLLLLLLISWRFQALRSAAAARASARGRESPGQAWPGRMNKYSCIAPVIIWGFPKIRVTFPGPHN